MEEGTRFAGNAELDPNISMQAQGLITPTIYIQNESKNETKFKKWENENIEIPGYTIKNSDGFSEVIAPLHED